MGDAGSDSENDLPPGWEERTTDDGKVFYANHLYRSTQWQHPRTGRTKRLVGDLPPDWFVAKDENNITYWANLKLDVKTYTDPRLAFAQEENLIQPMTSRRQARKLAPRQKFDASTKARNVLHGFDLTNKIYLITGATSGLGLECATWLHRHKATVILIGKRQELSNNCLRRFADDTGSSRIHYIQCDLTSLTAVRHTANRIILMNLIPDSLILNAGIYGLPYCQTDNNLELHFQVNYLAQYYLFYLMRPKLEASNKTVRLIWVSSESHRFLLNDFHEDDSLNLIAKYNSQNYWYQEAYNRSKLCQIWTSLALEEKLRKTKITSIVVHPGNLIPTNLYRHCCFVNCLSTLGRPFLKSVEQGASSILYAAIHPDMENRPARHYVNNCWFSLPSKAALNYKLQRKCLDLADDLIRSFEKNKL